MLKPKQYILVDGTKFEVRYERRRYPGMKFYTWVEMRVNEDWHSLGDPWQCNTPKRTEVIEAARSLLKQLGRTVPCDGSQHSYS